MLNLPYDHGEPRCGHTSTLINFVLIILSGVTQPFYKTEVKLEVDYPLFKLMMLIFILI